MGNIGLLLQFKFVVEEQATAVVDRQNKHRVM